MKMLQNHKEHCRKLCKNTPYCYGGFDSPYYCFIKGSYQTGFSEMKLLEEDLPKENFYFMAENNLTRV